MDKDPQSHDTALDALDSMSSSGFTDEDDIEKSPLIGYVKIFNFLEIQKTDPIIQRG